MSAFDKMSLNVTEAVRMPIIYPNMDEPIKDSEGNEGFLELLSEDSAEGRKFDRRMSKRTIQAIRRSGGRPRIDDDDPVNFQVDKIVSLLTGWHLVAPDGSVIDIPFNQDNAHDLMSNQGMAWLRKAAMAFVADAANFQKSPSSS